jgi:type III secretion system FlhB-like substrate exporter
MMEERTTLDMMEDIRLDTGYANPQVIADAELIIGDKIIEVASAAASAIGSAGKKLVQAIEEAHIGEKLEQAKNSIVTVVEDAHIGEKFTLLKESAGEKLNDVVKSVQEAHIPEKLEQAKNTVVQTVQDAHVGEKLEQAKDNVVKVVQDAHIPEKLENTKEVVVQFVQEQHIPENLTRIRETTKQSVANAVENVKSTFDEERGLIVTESAPVHTAPGSSAKETLKALYGTQYPEQLQTADDPIQLVPSEHSVTY